MVCATNLFTTHPRLISISSSSLDAGECQPFLTLCFANANIPYEYKSVHFYLTAIQKQNNIFAVPVKAEHYASIVYIYILYKSMRALTACILLWSETSPDWFCDQLQCQSSLWCSGVGLRGVEG